jgi:hypothetical protein
MGDTSKLFALGPAVLAELKPGGLQWCRLSIGLYVGYVMGSLWEQADTLGRSLLDTLPEPEARVTYVQALGDAVVGGIWRGAYGQSSAYLARLLALNAETSLEASLERAWSTTAQGIFSLHFEARLWQACLWLEQGAREMLKVGVDHSSLATQIQRALALEALGDRASAELLLRESLALVRASEQPMPTLYANLHLALFLAGSSEPAHREEALALTNGWEIDHILIFSGLRDTLRAKVAAARGELREAEHQARKACEKLAAFTFAQLTPRVLLSQVLLAQGRAAEAREVAAPGARELDALGGPGLAAVGMYLALAEAYLAEGDTQEGEAALRKALQGLRRRASEIPDAAARERFLLQVPENARTLELARQRWGAAELP